MTLDKPLPPPTALNPAAVADHDSSPEKLSSLPAPVDTSLISNSAQAAKFLILLQVSSRLLTFLVNQILLRFLSPVLLGISTQLEVLAISILYFSRESLRNALQRQSTGSEARKDNSGSVRKDVQTVINLSLLSVPLGIIFSVVLGYAYIRTASSEVASQPYFEASVVVYAVATVVELLAEPGFAVGQLLMLYKVRAAAESSAAMARCFVTCAVTVWGVKSGKDIGVLPFAIGQLAWGLTIFAVYWIRIGAVAKKGGFSMGLHKVEESHSKNLNPIYYASYIHLPHLSLAGTMWIQSSIKHILTQFDSLISALSSIHAQGIYALASNYGSLLARMLFQPIEEASRNLFAKLLAPSPSLSPSEGQTNILAARTILHQILRFYALLSILIVSLGPPFAPLALRLVAGQRWSDSGAAEALGSYCYLLPLLATNGVTEAFIQAVATPPQLHKQSAWMVSFTVGFAGAGYVFLKILGWGAEGLVAANAVSMVLRIVWSLGFIGSWFGGRGVGGGWDEVIPNGVTVAAAVAAGAVGRAMVGTEGEKALLRRLAEAGGVSGAVVVVVVVSERKFFLDVWKTIQSGR